MTRVRKGTRALGDIGVCSNPLQKRLTPILPSWEHSGSSPRRGLFASMGPHPCSNGWYPQPPTTLPPPQAGWGSPYAPDYAGALEVNGGPKGHLVLLSTTPGIFV